MNEPETAATTGPSGHDTGWQRNSGRVGWGITLLLIGTAWLLVALEVPVAWDVILPAAVIVVGALVMIVGRRARGDGLIGLGMVLAVLALLVVFVPGALSFTAGERVHRVTELAQLEDTAALGAGRLTVDLRDLELPTGVTEVDAGVTFGELVVLVPDGATVSGGATVAAGEIVGFGRATGGMGRSRTFDETGAAGAPVVQLDLGVGFGKIEVRR